MGSTTCMIASVIAGILLIAGIIILVVLLGEKTDPNDDGNDPKLQKTKIAQGSEHPAPGSDRPAPGSEQPASGSEPASVPERTPQQNKIVSREVAPKSWFRYSCDTVTGWFSTPKTTATDVADSVPHKV